MSLNKFPTIRALLKVRNEEHLIKDVLDHWAPICNGGFYIVDDVSTDKTVEICRAHPAVKDVIVAPMWNPDRERSEWELRQWALSRAQQDSGPDDWFVYLDADEFIYNFDDYSLFDNPNVKAIACRLYDFYITILDVDKSYKEREWIGPEFRTIVFFFKNSPYLKYDKPDQRIVNLEPDIQIPIHGDIKHYSKGFSIEQWEATCDYYIRWWPKYAAKWTKRKGKAVHKDYLSDFGNRLIRWTDRKQGFSLENQPYGLN